MSFHISLVCVEKSQIKTERLCGNLTFRAVFILWLGLDTETSGLDENTCFGLHDHGWR